MIFSVAITGPTASGKTALSISLATRLGGEIISCDSMQVYRDMNIGTAKATESERAAVPHHLIDFLSPLETYSAESYRADALRVAGEISDRGNIPIFVGGTGLYIDAVKRGVSLNAPESDPEYRDAILSSIKDEGDIDALWQRLKSVDPESAEKIHKNNVKRVIRALEIYDKTGRTKSELDRESRECRSDIFVGMITLDFHNRDILYDRCDRRVDAMMREGLLREVNDLYQKKMLQGQTASQAIGYKELVEYLEGRCTVTCAIEELKLATRRYAKRQLTWFRHEPDAVVIYVDKPDGSIKSVEELADEAALVLEKFREIYEKGNMNE